MSLPKLVKGRLKSHFHKYGLRNSAMSIFSAHPSIDKYTEKVCNFLEVAPGKRSVSSFKCGESYICLDSGVRDKNVYLIVPCVPDVNSRLMETFFYIDAFKAAEANEINIIMPSLPYARQDRRNEKREHIATRVLAKCFDALKGSNKARLITFDIHSIQTEAAYRDTDIEPLRLYSVFSHFILNFIAKEELHNLTLVSPDFGGVKRLEHLKERIAGKSKSCDVKVAFIHKRRPAHNQCEMCELVGEIKGRTAVIVDDIFDTGGSMLNAAKSIKEMGAKKVHALIAHSYFSGDSIQKLAEAQRKGYIDKFVFTDTIRLSDEKYKQVKQNNARIFMIPTTILLADVIARIQRGMSLSQIYDDSDYIEKLYKNVTLKEL
jgi:ribose-phosphate pyrophosphokinase